MAAGLPPPEVDGYRGLTEIGRGGFATVYRARDERFDRVVALKVFGIRPDEDTLRSFERECRATGALSWHPNVVVIHGTGTTASGQVYLDMEYLERGSLADRVRAEGPIHWAEVLTVGVQVAGALATTHTAGTLHRDLKPENLLVGRLGEVKLADFGIAIVDDAGRGPTEPIALTLSQAAPEVLGGDPATPRSDLYSLGSTLATLVMGRPPFVESGEDASGRNPSHHNTPATIAARVMRDPVPDLSAYGLPPDLCAFLAVVMAKDPADRPASAVAVGRALQGIQQAHGLPMTELRLERAAGGDDEPAPVIHARPAPASRPPPPGEEAPPPAKMRRRTKVLIGAGALLIVVAVAGGVALVVGSADDGGDAIGETGLPISTAFAVSDEVEVGQSPESVAVGDGAVWVANIDDETLSRIDPATNQVTDTIELDAPPRGVAFGEGSLWVTDRDRQGLTRLDPETFGPEATIAAGSLPTGVAVGEGGVWVTDLVGHQVMRVDPATNELVAAIDVGNAPSSITVGEGAVWVVSDDDGTVSRIEPATNEVTETARLGPPGRGFVATGGGSVWASNTEDSTVTELDPVSAEVVETVDVRGGAFALVVADGDLWVTLDDLSSVIRVDPTTATPIDAVDDAGVAGRIAADDGTIWVSRVTGTVTRIDATDGGG